MSYDFPTIAQPEPMLDMMRSTFHLAYVVQNHGDPLERGRVKLCCPGLYGEGKENWTNWTDMSNANIGTSENKGDAGIHWPAAPGQLVLLGFRAGDEMQPFAIPGPIWSDDSEKGKQLAPKEILNAAKKTEDHMNYCLKTPAGHTVIMNDTPEKESVSILHAGGFGITMDGGMTKKGEQPGKEEPSVYRKEYKRGDDAVASKTQKSPGEIYKNKAGHLRILGQNGSGITMVDAADGSGMIIRCADSMNSENGPSIFMSSLDGGSIILTAGKAQIQIRGKTGDVKFNKNIIQELIKYKVEIESVRPQMDTLSEVSKNALYTGGTLDQG